MTTGNGTAVANNGFDRASKIMQHLYPGARCDPADSFLDAGEPTDITVISAPARWPAGRDVVVRLRPDKYAEEYFWCFTLRARRENGDVELQRVLDGHSDYLLYGFVGEKSLVHFWLLDLDAMREAFKRFGVEFFQVGKEMTNTAEGTKIKIFDVRKFADVKCGIVRRASKAVAQRAIKEGIAQQYITGDIC